MKKNILTSLFVLFIFCAHQCWAQCGGLSIFIPPRVEALETKVLETLVVSEIPFFISQDPRDTTIVYIFSGEVSNCTFIASAPASKIENVKKQIFEKGAEVGADFRKTPFRCREQWEKKFDTP